MNPNTETTLTASARPQAAQHTPGPWRLWTSNSYRRISSDATGYDGDVLHATVHSDGQPDLQFPNGGFEGPDARLIVSAPELLRLLEELSNRVYGSGYGEPDEELRLRIVKATQPSPSHE